MARADLIIASVVYTDLFLFNIDVLFSGKAKIVCDFRQDNVEILHIMEWQIIVSTFNSTNT